MRRFVPAATLPPANHRAAADAWFLGLGRPLDPHEFVKMLRARLVGGDTLKVDRDTPHIAFTRELIAL